MKIKLFIKNAAILTASSLILRFAGIFFKVWLASKIGAEGIGLYSLVFSVYALVSTFAVCGTSTAVTRLVTDQLVLGSSATVTKILKRAVLLTLAVAVVSLLAVFFGADFIAARFIGDKAAAPALKILSFSLPFMGVSSCLKGYFIARRKTAPHSLSQIFEQTVRIIICIILIGKTAHLGIGASCFAVLFADTVAEAASCLFTYIAFLIDKKDLAALQGKTVLGFSLNRKLLEIALPIAGGRYLNSLLRTCENMLVPKALVKSGMSRASAVSVFGSVKGMALPILLFPSSLLSSVSLLLIPEMSELTAKGDKAGIRATAKRMLSITFSFSAIICAVFILKGGEFGKLIYSDTDCGKIITLLSPLIPIMYLDSVSDGILKGLDLQLITFRNSILDSTLRIILVLGILPFFGFYAFIGIMYFSNLLTFSLNLSRLLKVTGAKLDFIGEIAVPSVSAAVSVLVARLISLSFSGFLALLIFCVVSGAVYLGAGLIFGFLGLNNFKNMRNTNKKENKRC